jgi:hypothetical protein
MNGSAFGELVLISVAYARPDSDVPGVCSAPSLADQRGFRFAWP